MSFSKIVSNASFTPATLAELDLIDDFKKCHTAEMRKERDGDFTAVYFARRVSDSHAIVIYPDADIA